MTNGWLDCLELAEDPLSFNFIYSYKYFQNFSHFIHIVIMKTSSLASENTITKNTIK